MSIRKMKLKDYGITPGRAAELKEMVKDKQYYSLVIEACNRANEFLASHLVKSFTESVGYRQIFKTAIHVNFHALKMIFMVISGKHFMNLIYW